MAVGRSRDTILFGRVLKPNKEGCEMFKICNFCNFVPTVVGRSQDTVLCGRGLSPVRGGGGGGRNL